jgi:hypothetical protein
MTRMRWIARLVKIGLALSLIPAASALALGSIAPNAAVDQSNPPRAIPCRYTGWAPDFADSWAAQTFTAAVTGYLSDVVLPLNGTITQITVAIAPVDAAGAPVVASPLAATTTPFTPVKTFGDVEVSFATPAKVESGKQYAIVLSAPNQNFYEGRYVVWNYDAGSSLRDPNGTPCADGAYAGGRAWGMGIEIPGPGSDFFFRTYVVPVKHVSVQKSGAGGGTVQDDTGTLSCGAACSADFRFGQTVVLTATPDAKSTFAGWSGACSGGAQTCSITVGADASVTASFVEKAATITVRRSGMGAVVSRAAGINCGKKCRATVAPGVVNLLALPAVHWRFLRWQGACRGTKPGCRLTLAAASMQFVTAVFAAKS